MRMITIGLLTLLVILRIHNNNIYQQSYFNISKCIRMYQNVSDYSGC